MKRKNLLYISFIFGLLVFSIFIVQKADTNKIRQQEANASEIKLEVSTDPAFQEYMGEIVAGFPEDFPVFPGAELSGSVINNSTGTDDTGYRVKWYLPVGISVIEVVDWYVRELRVIGWEVEEPDVWEGISELVLQIERDNLKGYIAAENEEDKIEFVADLKIQ